VLLLIVFAVLFAIYLDRPDANLTRTVLFTLGKNEEMGALKSYSVLQQAGQNHFVCIINDLPNPPRTFVFNGKRIAVGDDFKWLEVHYLNMLEEDGYVVTSRLQGMEYVNIKGKVHGPFDCWSLTFAKDSNGNANYDKFYYYKTEGGNRDYYLHYNGAEEGPLEGIRFPEETSAYTDCEYLYLSDGKWYARYSNGSNKATSLFAGYEHWRDGQWYVNINGRDSKGYDDVDYLHFTKSGNHAYSYKENGKEHVCVNINDTGKSSRGYDDVRYLRLAESGKYVYAYKENEKWHVNINGKESRGYDYIQDLRLAESGKYAYTYVENGKNHVNLDGKDQGSRGYDEIGDLYLTENGNCAYKYRENGKYHVNVNINGEDKSGRGYDKIENHLRLTESGNYAYTYEENEKWHVNINGKESGEYDYVAYSTLFLTESGKYAYQYGENGKVYVIINIDGTDKISRGHDYVIDLSLAEDGNYSFYYPNDEGKVDKNENGTETETEYLSGMNGKNDPLPFFKSIYHHYSDLKIYSTDKKHSFYSSSYSSVKIDGKYCKSSRALFAWYDKTKHAFIWNAVEGKELVVYEYKLN
jgi:hypothetical protein